MKPQWLAFVLCFMGVIMLIAFFTFLINENDNDCKQIGGVPTTVGCLDKQAFKRLPRWVIHNDHNN